MLAHETFVLSGPSKSEVKLRHPKPPSQTWRTFLDNHVKTMVSVDFFTVPTIRFQVLYVFLVLAHERRRVVDSTSPIPPRSGRHSNYGRRFLLIKLPAICSAAGTKSSVTSFAAKSLT